jgi:hypothetical protein
MTRAIVGVGPPEPPGEALLIIELLPLLLSITVSRGGVPSGEALPLLFGGNRIAEVVAPLTQDHDERIRCLIGCLATELGEGADDGAL